MRVGIDARMLSMSGIGTYLRSLLAGLSRHDGETEYVLFLRKEDMESCADLGSNFRRVACAAPLYSAAEQTLLPLLAARAPRPDSPSALFRALFRRDAHGGDDSRPDSSALPGALPLPASLARLEVDAEANGAKGASDSHSLPAYEEGYFGARGRPGGENSRDLQCAAAWLGGGARARGAGRAGRCALLLLRGQPQASQEPAAAASRLRGFAEGRERGSPPPDG